MAVILNCFSEIKFMSIHYRPIRTTCLTYLRYTMNGKGT